MNTLPPNPSFRRRPRFAGVPSTLGALLCAGLCALPLPLSAQTGDWQTVVRDRNRSVELDKATILDAQGGNKVAWARIVLAEGEAAEVGYAMIKALNRFDCEGRRFATVRRLYLDAALRVLREEAVPDPTPRPIARGGVDERLWREVCRPPNMSDLHALAASAERAAGIETPPRGKPGSAPAESNELRDAPPAPVSSLPLPEHVDTRRQPAEPARAVAVAPQPPAQTPPPPLLPSLSGKAENLPAHGAVALANRRAVPGANPYGWQYDGPRGPAKWGQLDPAWRLCTEGRRQSPIDLVDPIRVGLEAPRFDYREGYFRIADTGYTIAVRPGDGNHLWLRGERYTLERIEFRHPAEERIEGRVFDMSAELIHRDDYGRLAVVVVPLEAGGAPNPALRVFWNNLPLGSGQELLPSASFDPAHLLPASLAYYLYEGSLTTPPCGEGVLRVVLRTPLPIGEEQRDVYARLYPVSARPLQPDYGRRVLRSD